MNPPIWRQSNFSSKISCRGAEGPKVEFVLFSPPPVQPLLHCHATIRAHMYAVAKKH